MTLARHLAVALGVAVSLLLSIRLSPFRDYQMAEVAAYVAAVAGLTVLIGLSGQISLGNGAFMAIGAYAAALLLLHLHWPLALVLLASAVAAAGRRGLRRRRGPAARPVPGGRHADARRGPALAGPAVRRVRRRPGAHRRDHAPASSAPLSRSPAGRPG